MENLTYYTSQNYRKHTMSIVLNINGTFVRGNVSKCCGYYGRDEV